MKRISTTAFVLSLALLVPCLLSAQDLSERIPKTALNVITINPGPHVSNGDFSNITQLEMFTRNGISSDGAEQSPAQKFLSDIFAKPAETGIDNTQKIFLFNEKLDTISHWTFVFPISGSATFRTYVTEKLFGQAPTIEKGFGYEFVNKERLGIAWTEGFAMVMMADYDHWYANSYGYENYNDVAVTTQMIADSIAAVDAARAAEEQMNTSDSLPADSVQKRLMLQMQREMDALNGVQNNTDSLRKTIEDNTEDYSERAARLEREQQEQRDMGMNNRVKERIRYLMNMLPADAVVSIRNFKTIQSEPFDVAYWYNYSEMMRQTVDRVPNYMLYTGMADTIAKRKSMWEDCYVASLARFSGGEMHVSQRMYMNPDLAARTKGMYAGKVDKKIYRYIKSENLMGYASLSMNTEKMFKFTGSAYRETMSMYDRWMQGTLFTSWDIARVFVNDDVLYNLFSGDIVVAFTDLRPFTASYVTYDYDENFNRTEIRKERTEVMPEFVSLVSIGKKKEAQQILDIIEKANGIKKQGTDYYTINLPGSYDFRVFLALKNGLLIITNNEELVHDKLKKGYSANQRMSRKQVKEARRSPLMVYWDGTKTFDLVSKQMDKKLSRRERKTMASLQSGISSAELAGTRPVNGVQSAELTVKFTEAGNKESSIVRFFRILNTLYLN